MGGMDGMDGMDDMDDSLDRDPFDLSWPEASSPEP